MEVVAYVVCDHGVYDVPFAAVPHDASPAAVLVTGGTPLTVAATSPLYATCVVGPVQMYPVGVYSALTVLRDNATPPAAPVTY